MKARYLLRFSYIGTHFRGAEKLWMKSGLREIDPQTVQGVIEIALKNLRSLHPAKLVLSSRTDGGVHALSTTGHVDLERYGTRVFEPEVITSKLNSYFSKNTLSILIHNVQRVPDDFSARFNAISRSYLYRFAILRKDAKIPEQTYNILYPVEEWRRCHFIRKQDFDIEKFKAAAAYLPGYHDWSTFKRFDSKLDFMKHNRRTLHSVDIRPSRSMVILDSRRDQDVFDYWEVEFRGQGFVHNQLRRIVGVLIAIAEGKIPVEEIKVMLQVPSKHSWPTRASCAPPHGLYLSNVEYDPKDLEFCEGSDSVVIKNEVKSDDDE